ncbi:hypothetical protein [Desulfofundulus kuznetsovii]
MSKIETLKRMRKEYKAPDDVFEALLSQVEGQYIPKDPAIIHDAIYRLAQEQGFRELLKDFHFDTSGISPFSDLLDRVLFRLEISGILGTIEPKFERYVLSRRSKAELLETYREKFSPDEQEILRRMSAVFENYLRCAGGGKVVAERQC